MVNTKYTDEQYKDATQIAYLSFLKKTNKSSVHKKRMHRRASRSKDRSTERGTIWVGWKVADSVLFEYHSTFFKASANGIFLIRIMSKKATIA